MRLKNLSINSLTSAGFQDKSPDPVLVEEGYKGFNFVRYGDEIYAIPQREGAFQIERIEKNKYSQWFSGNSLEEVRALLDTSAPKNQVKIVKSQIPSVERVDRQHKERT